MHNKETVSQPAALCKIVNISDCGGYRKQQIDKWLRQRMSGEYGNDDVALNNPLLRIDTKFDALSPDAQMELFGFAKGYVLGLGGSISLRKKLWSILEIGKSDAWEAVEEFADSLIVKEKIYKQSYGGVRT